MKDGLLMFAFKLCQFDFASLCQFWRFFSNKNANFDTKLAFFLFARNALILRAFSILKVKRDDRSENFHGGQCAFWAVFCPA